MANIASYYTKEVHQHFKVYWATWTPNAPLQLGDFGFLDGDVFCRQGNIATDFGISVEERSGTDYGAHYAFSSGKSTSVTMKAKGEVEPGGIARVNAEMEIKFGDENAVYFNAAQCRVDSAGNQNSLGKQLIGLFEKGKWDPKWFVVTEVLRAGATTVAISNAKQAALTFEAEGDVVAIDMANADISLGVKSEVGIGLKVVASKNATPLIRLAALRKRNFLQKERVFRLTDSDSGEIDDVFRQRIIAAELTFEEMVEFSEISPV